MRVSRQPRTFPRALALVSLALGGAVGVVVACGAVAAAGAQEPAALPPAASQDASTVPRISQDEFKAQLAEGKVYVVDVRTAVSFVAGHIPGAVNVPLDEVLGRADEAITLAGTRAIVTYCSCPSEHTAAEAGLIFIARGSRTVRALQGGYIDWVRGGGKIERRD
jgi:rhodanese-related sulfurtransferase